MVDKPHKGTISRWHKSPCERGLGYMINGILDSHPDPDLSGQFCHTSWVEKHDEATGEIETRNSRYTLVGPETMP